MPGLRSRYMKPLLKLCVSWGCRLLVLPLVGIVKLTEIFIQTDQPFQFGSQTVSLIPGIPGNYFRKEYYRMTLEKCAPDVCIEFGTILHQSRVKLGHRVYIGARCSIGECAIEDDAIIGSNVDVISGRHQHLFHNSDTSIREQEGALDRIIIGTDSWIGNSAVIMANIGRKSVIGAGSVVVQDVEPYSVMGGNPARLLRNRQGVARRVG